jgi:hypothetical protein
MDDSRTSGTELQVHELTQGISPFDDREGAAEWQTSRFPRKDLPSFTIMIVNEVIGARTVNAIMTRRMIVTDFTR